MSIVGMLAVNIFAIVFIVFVVGIPLYLYFTRPRVSKRYRSSKKRTQRQALAASVSFLVLLFVFIIILGVTSDVFTELVSGDAF